jgi:microcystin degradation protein MlrC
MFMVISLSVSRMRRVIGRPRGPIARATGGTLPERRRLCYKAGGADFSRERGLRILVAGFQHETNSFAPSPTTYEDFVRGGAFPALTRGADVLHMRDVNIPIGGFIRAMEKRADLIPVLWAGATPAAHVTRDAFERIAGEIVAAAVQQKPDAIYLDLHGAMYCEHLDDGEGELLARLRAAMGLRVPIVASLDLHANVTMRMLEKADALTAYRTYPHVDMAETGDRAAFLLSRIVERSNALYRAQRRIPFLIPLNAMCSLMDPAKSIYDRMAVAEKDGGLSLSFTPAFPAADFPECGPMVWGYGETGLVEREVSRLADEITAREAEWMVPLLEPEEAVREAMRISARASRPVVIADTQDNPGGGGDSDTTGMLRALVACGATEAAIGLIVDPAAAAAAHAAGMGADIAIGLGGHSRVPGDAPFEATYRVEQLSDGTCRYDGPMLHGKESHLGPSARLSIGGVQIVVTSHKDQMLDRNLYRMAVVEPEKMKILINKSSVHFRADFQPIAEAVLVARAPGPLLADPADYPWTRLAPGMRLRPLGPAFKGEAA